MAEEVGTNDAGDLIPEVRTRRLVVVDDDGHERIVGEVVSGYAELRLDLPGTAPERSTSLLLFASDVRGNDQGPSLGFQLWIDGDSVLGFSAHEEGSGVWVADVQLSDQ